MRKLATIVFVVAILAGLAVFNAKFAPSRMTEARSKAQEDAVKALEEIHEKMEAQAGDAPLQLAENPASETGMTKLEDVPDKFKVKFECSNGSFVMELHKEWAPLGVQRMYDLVKADFFNEARFFRVVPNFVVQWGIPADPAVAAKWRENGIKDEPVKQSNTQGMVTFAKSGLPNSRTTQLFISLNNNQNLDNMGFAPIGKIIEGFNVVKEINSQYGERPDQAQIQAKGNEYLKAQFPNLDFIKSASIILDEADTSGTPSAPETPKTETPTAPKTPSTETPTAPETPKAG